MFSRNALCRGVWSAKPRIIFEDTIPSSSSPRFLPSAASSTASSSSPPSYVAASARHLKNSRSIKVEHLCGGQDSNLHSIVSGSRALKQYVESIPSKEAVTLSSRSALNRKQELVSRLYAEQKARVMAARQQLRVAKKQLKRLKLEAKKDVVQTD